MGRLSLLLAVLSCVLLPSCRAWTWGCNDGCHCAAEDWSWCVNWGDSRNPKRDLREFCGDLGGRTYSGYCTRDVDEFVGACIDGDSCLDKEYFFYDNYSGGIPGVESLDEAEEACTSGELKGCPEWI